MPQIGVNSVALLMQHDHLNASQGGVLNDYSRYGAYRRPYRTGALAVHTEDNNEKTNTAAVFQLIKQIKILKAQPGRFVISYGMYSEAGHNVHGRFYVNGVAKGTDNVTAQAVEQTYTDNWDHDLAVGDLIQIYAYKTFAGDVVHIARLWIEYDWGLPGFGDGTIDNLVTMLPLSDTDALSTISLDP